MRRLLVREKNFLLLLSVVVCSLLIWGCGGGGNPAGTSINTVQTANLSGQVTMQGQPLTNANVFLYKSKSAHLQGISQLGAIKGSMLASSFTSDGSYSTQTDSLGRYSFTDIPVGEYTLIAVKDENHQFALPNVMLGSITQVDAQLTPTGSISGKVEVNDNGTVRNVTGAFVYLEGTSYVALTNSTGDFKISHVPANQSFTLRVVSGSGMQSNAQAITLLPAENRDIGTITLTPLAISQTAISGSVVKTGFTPVATDSSGLIVVLTGLNGQESAATLTDVAGDYSFLVEASGTYSISVVPGQLMVNPQNQQVNVDLSGPVAVPQITVSPMGPEDFALTGQINKAFKIGDETDESGVVVSLESLDATNPIILNTVSNAAGFFGFGDLKPGDYNLEINGAYELVSTASSPITISNSDIDLGTLNVRPQSNVAAVIDGYVDAVSAEPFRVLLTRIGAASTVEYHQETPVGTTTFKFVNLAPGTYSLRLDPSKNGFSGQTGNFLLNPGEKEYMVLPGTYVAPAITTVSPAVSNANIVLTGSNFDNIAPLSEGIVDGNINLPVFNITGWTATNIEFDTSNLAPGTHTIRIINPDKSMSNDFEFLLGINPPVQNTPSSTSDSVTAQWQNAKFAEGYDVLLQLPDDTYVNSATNVRSLNHTFVGLSPNTDYKVSISSRFNNSLVSQPSAPQTIKTRANSIMNPEKIALDTPGTWNVGAPGEVGPFAVLNGNFFLVAEDSGGSVELAKFSGIDGAFITSISFPAAEVALANDISLVAGNNSIYLAYINSATNDAEVVLYDENLANLGSIGLGVSSTYRSIEIDFGSNQVFVMLVDSPDGDYASYFKLDANLTTFDTSGIYERDYVPALTGSRSIVADADPSNGNYYVAIASYTGVTGYPPDYLEMFEMDSTAWTGPRTTIATVTRLSSSPYIREIYAGPGNKIGLIDSTNTIFSIDKLSGSVLKIYGELGSILLKPSHLLIDSKERFWFAEVESISGSGGTDYSYCYKVLDRNGNLLNKIPIYWLPNYSGGATSEDFRPHNFIQEDLSNGTINMLALENSTTISVYRSTNGNF